MHTMTVVRVILSPKDEESEKHMLRSAQHDMGCHPERSEGSRRRLLHIR